MSEPKTPSIQLENITVRYRAPAEPIGTFKEYMIRSIQGKIHHRDFTALNNVSLNIYEGEVLGIVGLNGAGKSTLLKVIARVIYPNAGRVVIRGKVAPLLELGAGFHPELTGRENVFLNGSILGYSSSQMKQKFPSIVEFSELGDFIEAPMRTYSSGMWARLGFAVATDARPEILLVDEILAVGDEAFQKKCLDRILQFQAAGTTIILVSHNMDQVRDFCSRAALLFHGNLKAVDTPEAVIAEYRRLQTA